MKNKTYAMQNEKLLAEDKIGELKGDELADRLLAFAVDILKFSNTLPMDLTTKQIITQIFRSSTSAGANYEEARGAESKADFVHKLGIVLKELKETRFWLRLILHAEIADLNKTDHFLQECEELCAIIARSIITARNH